VKLDLASHGSGSVVAYVLLCLIVALFGLADAFVQGAMVGDLSFMSPDFIQVKTLLYFCNGNIHLT